ncbi:response regulator [bacterium]|nr:response regulator [bacterium]
MDHKPRILVVDDEADTRTFFAALLEDHGYTVDTAEDGQIGLEKAAATSYDLITLDLSMPEVSGLKFYREMRGEGEPHTPIVVISGVARDMKTFISTRKQVPAPDGYLAKPVDQDEMLRLVENLLSVPS